MDVLGFSLPLMAAVPCRKGRFSRSSVTGTDRGRACNTYLYLPRFRSVQAYSGIRYKGIKTNSGSAYETYIDSVRAAFRKRYISHCLNAVEEEFTMTFEHQEYHYTLYYYDQAGNLVQTVPPQGVELLTDATELNKVKLARVSHVNNSYPNHGFTTRYQFNTLNQLTAQTTPDAGRSTFFYDRLGRMAVSQNAKQEKQDNYSYTEYDALGRIKEVGQLSPGVMTIVNPKLIDQVGIDVDELTGVITKNVASSWGNSGSSTSKSIKGDGFVEFTIPNPTSDGTALMVGLSYQSLNNHYTDIDYKWYIVSTSNTKVYNGNSVIATYGNPITGQVFRVERSNDTVYYKIDGVIKNFVVETVKGQPLVADFSIYANGHSIHKLTIGGEFGASFDMVFHATNLTSFLAVAQKEEITETYYDEAIFTINKDNFTQKHLRNRVVSTTYREQDTLPYQSAVHYTYDIHGNVYSLVRETPELKAIKQDFKQTDYDYDLVSGNVKAVHYQRGAIDQFSHRYNYDLDNRLTRVETSEDEVHWDQEIKYFYYKHGPLARAEIGALQVQGMDYAYTLHGWLKGVNSTSLNTERDMGQDAHAGSINQYVCKDEFGYSLGYYENDYKNIGNIAGANVFYATQTGSSLKNKAASLYNGNISTMVTAIGQFMDGETPLGKAYSYDQLNRIVGASYFENYDSVTNAWKATGTEMEAYKSAYSYDANGNILTLDRNGITGNTAMDAMSYHYINGTNKLSYVTDIVNKDNYTSDIDNQELENYQYDEIGNLVKDEAEEIANIEWTVYGKIKKITRERVIVPTYKDMVGVNHDLSTGEIEKSAGNNTWTSHCVSGHHIMGDGYVEYTIPGMFHENKEWRFGLSYVNNMGPDPDYSIYTGVGDEAFDYIFGTWNGNMAMAGIGPGSTIRVERIGNMIYYTVNGIVQHSMLESNLGMPMRMHLQLYSEETRVYVNNIILDDMGMQFVPAIHNLVETELDVAMNVLQKGPYDGWYSGGASVESISGDGFVKFQLQQNQFNKEMVVGLSYSNTDHDYSTVGYGWSTNDGVSLQIVESGTMYSITHDPVQAGDVLKVKRTGNTIYYYHNSSLVRTTTQSGSGNMLLDFALFQKDCILQGVQMSSDDLSQVASKPDMEFGYTPDGHRSMKRTIYKDSSITTWYTRDATGNIISTYEQIESSFTQRTTNIYGSSKVGVHNSNKEIVIISGNDTSYISMNTSYATYTRGKKHYELSNDLGTIQVVLTDKRLPVCNESSGITESYMAEVISAYDYYPFGASMKDRTYEFEKHGFGYNGMEKDDDIKGQGNSYDFGARIFDSRIGRWFSPDPYDQFIASPYFGFLNNPLIYTDRNGEWIPIVNDAGKVSYKAESGDSYNTFMKQFDVTDAQATSIFKKSGYELFLPFVNEDIDAPNVGLVPGETVYPTFIEGSTVNNEGNTIIKMKVDGNSKDQIGNQVLAAFRAKNIQFANRKEGEKVEPSIEFKDLFDDPALLMSYSGVTGRGGLECSISIDINGKKVDVNIQIAIGQYHGAQTKTNISALNTTQNGSGQVNYQIAVYQKSLKLLSIQVSGDDVDVFDDYIFVDTPNNENSENEEKSSDE